MFEILARLQQLHSKWYSLQASVFETNKKNLIVAREKRKSKPNIIEEK